MEPQNRNELVPIEISQSREGTVVLANFFDAPTEVEIVNSIQAAFSSGQDEPNLERIVTIDPAAEFHALDGMAL